MFHKVFPSASDDFSRSIQEINVKIYGKSIFLPNYAAVSKQYAPKNYKQLML